ncbi:MAG: ATP-binding protein [Spirochaetales bacterium]|nr:ATP-binding protein [Spirochaetales bacterium]
MFCLNWPELSWGKPVAPADFLLSRKHEPWLARILLKVQAAMQTYRMLPPDEGVMVGLSGGKDSLALLVCLHILNRGIRPLKACHVQNLASPDASEALESMAMLCGEMDIPFIVSSIQLDQHEGCYACAHARRKALLAAASDAGCSRLALGHTRKDFAATALLNLSTRGRLETLEPVRSYFGNSITVIRPLMYLEDADVRRLVRRLNLSICKNPCPLAGRTARSDAEQALVLLENRNPHAALHIMRAALASSNLSVYSNR